MATPEELGIGVVPLQAELHKVPGGLGALLVKNIPISVQYAVCSVQCAVPETIARYQYPPL